MIFLKWTSRLLWDLVLYGFVNRAIGMSLTVIALLFLGTMIIATKAAAPFIYTLF